MVDIQRIVVAWTGSAVVGSSSTSFYSLGTAASLQTAVKNWGATIMGLCPPNLSCEVPSTGDTLDSATGDIVGSWSAGTPGTTVGSGGTTYQAGVGIRLTWPTGSRTRGRPCIGSTFIVPVSNAVFDNTGTPTPTALTAAAGAGANLVTALAGNMVVWTRPQTGLSNGGTATVTGCHVPDSVSWLRSRRT